MTTYQEGAAWRQNENDLKREGPILLVATEGGMTEILRIPTSGERERMEC